MGRELAEGERAARGLLVVLAPLGRMRLPPRVPLLLLLPLPPHLLLLLLRARPLSLSLLLPLPLPLLLLLLPMLRRWRPVGRTHVA